MRSSAEGFFSAPEDLPVARSATIGRHCPIVSIEIGSSLFRSSVSFAILLVLSTANGVAQTTESPSNTEEAVSPEHGFLVTGYGSASFRAVFAENSTPNNFARS